MREEAELDRGVDRPQPHAYEPPAILWEEELPQGPHLFAACGKVGGTGDLCNASPGS
jgi:hypothetical protein